MSNMELVMQIFRRIIGVIARIDKTGWVILEYIMRDLDVDIVDLRVWLRLMEVMGLVDFWCESDRVVLRLMYLDALGFDISKLEEL